MSDYSKNTWIDEVLATPERYTILEDGGGAFKDDMQISLKQTPSQEGSGLAAGWMNNIEEFLESIATIKKGWIPVTDNWTYASATTINVPSGAASIYSKGDRLMFTNNTLKKLVVVGIADELLTVTGGSDYVVENAAISAISYSKIAQPVGFPTGFALAAPSWDLSTLDDSSGGQPDTAESYCQIIGSQVTLSVQSGSSNSVKVTTDNKAGFTIPATLPDIEDASRIVLGSAYGAAGGGIAGVAIRHASDKTQVLLRYADTITNNDAFTYVSCKIVYKF